MGIRSRAKKTWGSATTTRPRNAAAIRAEAGMDIIHRVEGLYAPLIRNAARRTVKARRPAIRQAKGKPAAPTTTLGQLFAGTELHLVTWATRTRPATAAAPRIRRAKQIRRPLAIPCAKTSLHARLPCTRCVTPRTANPAQSAWCAVANTKHSLRRPTAQRATSRRFVIRWSGA